MVKLLLASGANPGAKGKVRPRTAAARGAERRLTRVAPAQHGRTALHAASEKGHLEVAKVLLANAADIKAQDKVRAALRAAAQHVLARVCVSRNA